MKKILIDATSLSDQYKQRGIGTYSYEVISRLVKHTDIQWHLLCYQDIAEHHALGKNVHYHDLGPIKMSGIGNIFDFKQTFLPIIKSINPDIYFCPQFDRGIPDKYKSVVMIHDIIPMVMNSYSQKGFLQNIAKGLFYKYQFHKASKANIVITNSNFSKSELIKASIPEKKINVIYLGVNEEFREKEINTEIIKSIQLPDSYLLYYGGFEKNKNVLNLLMAYKIFASRHNEVSLVIVTNDIKKSGETFIAQNSNGNAVAQFLKENDFKNKIYVIPSQRQKVLAQIMKKAHVFVHLSVYEGFGLSVAEAIVSGIPAVISSASSYPELFDGAALFTNPYNINDIVSSIEKIYFEESTRSSIIAGEKKLAENFSWDKCAAQTYELLVKA